MEKISWRDSDLREAIKTKLPEWFATVERYGPPGLDRATHLKDVPCPQCNKISIFCIRNDFGHIDSKIKCAHICMTPGCEYLTEDEIEDVSFPDVETSKYYCSICK